MGKIEVFIVLLVLTFAAFTCGAIVGAELNEYLTEPTIEYYSAQPETKWFSDSLQVALNSTLQENYSLLRHIDNVELDLTNAESKLAQANRYGGLIEFESVQALMDWLKDNKVSQRKYVPVVYDCDDFVRELVLDALREGKLMGLSRISDERHQKAWTIIGNDIYEIEATNDGVKRVGRVD